MHHVTSNIYFNPGDVLHLKYNMPPGINRTLRAALSTPMVIQGQEWNWDEPLVIQQPNQKLHSTFSCISQGANMN